MRQGTSGAAASRGGKAVRATVSGMGAVIDQMSTKANVVYVTVLLYYFLFMVALGVGVGVAGLLDSSYGVFDKVMIAPILIVTWLIVTFIFPPVIPLLVHEWHAGRLRRWASVQVAETRAVALNVPFVLLAALAWWAVAQAVVEDGFLRELTLRELAEIGALLALFGIPPVLVTLWSVVQRQRAENRDVGQEIDEALEGVFAVFRSHRITQSGYVAVCVSCGDVTVLDLGRARPCPSCRAIVSMASKAGA